MEQDLNQRIKFTAINHFTAFLASFSIFHIIWLLSMAVPAKMFGQQIKFGFNYPEFIATNFFWTFKRNFLIMVWPIVVTLVLGKLSELFYLASPNKTKGLPTLFLWLYISGLLFSLGNIFVSLIYRNWFATPFAIIGYMSKDKSTINILYYVLAGIFGFAILVLGFRGRKQFWRTCPSATYAEQKGNPYREYHALTFLLPFLAVSVLVLPFTLLAPFSKQMLAMLATGLLFFLPSYAIDYDADTRVSGKQETIINRKTLIFAVILYLFDVFVFSNNLKW